MNLHADLGRHEQLVTIDRAGEVHTFLGDLAHGAQTPHLKAPAVGKNGLVPFFKLVQPAKALHDVQAWTHPQVKRVAQNDLRAHVVQALWRDAFYRAVGAHGHEDWRLHHTVVQRQAAAAGVCAQISAFAGYGGGVGLEEVEFQHGTVVCGPGRASTDFRSPLHQRCWLPERAAIGSRGLVANGRARTGEWPKRAR